MKSDTFYLSTPSVYWTSHMNTLKVSLGRRNNFFHLFQLLFAHSVLQMFQLPFFWCDYCLIIMSVSPKTVSNRHVVHRFITPAESSATLFACQFGVNRKQTGSGYFRTPDLPYRLFAFRCSCNSMQTNDYNHILENNP